MLLSIIKFGVVAIAYSLLISTVASMFINSWSNKKLLGYSFIEQIKDIIPNIVMVVCVTGLVSLIKMLELSDFVTLMIQIFSGVVMYISLSNISKEEIFYYLWNMIKRVVKK